MLMIIVSIIFDIFTLLILTSLLFYKSCEKHCVSVNINENHDNDLMRLYKDIDCPPLILSFIEELIQSVEIDVFNLCNDQNDDINYNDYVNPINYVKCKVLKYVNDNIYKYESFTNRIKYMLEVMHIDTDQYLRSNEIYNPSIKSIFNKDYNYCYNLRDYNVDEYILGRWIYDKTMLTIKTSRDNFDSSI